MIQKFKGWNTNTKIMYSAEELGKDELTISPDGRGFVNVSSSSQKLSQYMSHIIPLQFIGLLDKNGVEIYEGDIVKIVNSRGVIEYRSGAFIIVRVDTATYAMTNNVNIIGNIHENPELMEE